MKVRRLLFLFALILSVVLPQSIVAHAESLSNLKVSILTDRQSYSENDEMKYTLTISNTSDSLAKNIVVTSTVPDGLEVVSKDIKQENGKLVWNIDSINAFDKATVNFTAKVKNAGAAAKSPLVSAGTAQDSGTAAGTNGSAPKTGDDTSFIKYYALLIISGSVLILALAALKKKRLRKTITPIIIVTMILPSFTAVKAAELKETVSEVHTVTVNNKEYKLTVTVEGTLDVDNTLVLKAQRNFGVPQLEWKANGRTDAVYQVKRGQTSDSLEVIAENVKENSYTDESSKPEQKYFYCVVAVKDGKEIYQSNTVLVQPFMDSDKDGLADNEETNYKTDVNNSDTDADGLVDGEEVFQYKTDPLKKDTDGDGLLDGFEISYSDSASLDPLKKDTDDNGTADGEEDFDSDGITTILEQQNNTNPFESDTDSDGLTDGDELNQYKTNPALADTDKDQLDDGSEIKFGTNPLVMDTNGNGVIDGLEKREQILSENDQNVELTLNATGDIEKTTTIIPDKAVSQLVGNTGVVGQPVNITTSSQFDSANLSFTYDSSQLNGIKPENLRVFYYDPNTRQLTPVKDQQVNTETSTVSANLEHFSTYLLGDISLWEESWQENLQNAPAPDSSTKQKPLDLVLVIDSSGSMEDNDPTDVRIDGAKKVIDSLKAGDQAAVVGDRGAVVDFDDWAMLLQGLTENKTALKKAVDKIDSWGGTDIGEGVSRALTELETNGRPDSSKAIILLTDGEGSYDSSLTAKAKNMGVKISTIGLGDSIDKTLLQRIADGTGGDFYYAASADILDTVLQNSKDQLDNRDTDGDGIPDWVEKLAEANGGFILKGTFNVPFINKTISLQQQLNTKYNKSDTDGDKVNDADELGGLGNIYVSPDKTKVYLKDTPRSNPAVIDTDSDSYDDNDDLKPLDMFKIPIVLIHGRTDNSHNLYGVNTLISTEEQAYNKDQYIMDNVISYGNIDRDKTIALNGEKYYRASSQAIKDIVSSKPASKDRPENLGYELQKEGYIKNLNLFALNYPSVDFNWKNADLLKWYVEEILKEDQNCYPTRSSYNNRALKVDLIGHSNGGLVSRYYIENLNGSQYVDKLITMDTPHWGSGLATTSTNTLLFFKGPMDIDLRPDSMEFGGTKTNMNYLEPIRTYFNNYQTKALNYKNHGSTEYDFIAGYDDFAPYLLPSGLKGKTIIFDVNPKSNSFGDFRQSIADGFFNKYPSYQSTIQFTFTENGGDNVVNNQSQLGVTYGDFGNGKKISADSYTMVIDTITGHNAYNNLHGQVPHRSETINKVIQYLND